MPNDEVSLHSKGSGIPRLRLNYRLVLGNLPGIVAVGKKRYYSTYTIVVCLTLEVEKSHLRKDDNSNNDRTEDGHKV